MCKCAHLYYPPMAAATSHLKFQNQPINIKRRRCRETTITTTITPTPAILDSSSYSSSATVTASTAKATACTTRNQCQSRKVDTHIVISPENFRCCSATKPPLQPPVDATDTPQPTSPLLPSSSDLKIHFSPSTMGSFGTTAQDSFPSSLIKFNSALTAGLLKPMSPPSLVDKTRSSPTLFEMMASDADSLPRATNGVAAAQDQQNSKHPTNPTLEDKQAQKQQRLMDLLASRSSGNQFNDVGSSDVKLILSSKDGVSVAISLHRQILVVHSRFFALNMNEKWVKQQGSSVPYNVEIADCDDIEVYIETLRLMYCKDLRKKLMKEDVPRVLDILKVSAAIGFDAAAESCLEYLAAAPWAEDEEEKVVSLLSELQLEGVGVGEVLKRVSLNSTPSLENGNGNEQVLLKLLQVVLEGKDEKARREMKVLVTKMLRENPSQNDLRKESLYFACDGCLKLLSRHFLNAAQGDVRDVGQIARQADNLHWLLDILIDRQIGEDFLNIWASQSELSEAHPKVSPVHRYEVSQVSARFFVGIGKKQVLASKDARCLLLKTWLVPFYEDFGWMRRASGGLDRHLIEEGLSSTISTLPMDSQQEIFVSWFNRFLNGGDDCPNIQRGFEVWWRRAFQRRNGEVERPPLMRVVSGTVEKSRT